MPRLKDTPLCFFELKSVARKLMQRDYYKTLSKEDKAFVKHMDTARSFTRKQKERLTKIHRAI